MWLGPVVVDSCPRCGNVWFDNSELERISADADGVDGKDLRDAVRALHPDATPLGPFTVPCPLCENILERRNHPTVPGVVAQVCFWHGAWIERLYLLRLIDDLESRGLDGLHSRKASRAMQEQAHERSHQDHLQQVTAILRRHLYFWMGW